MILNNMKKKIKLIFIITNIIFFIYQPHSNSEEIINKLIVSVNNKTITTLDIKKEIKYLAALKIIDIEKFSKKERRDLVLNQMIKDKVKNIELSKYLQDEIDEEKYFYYIQDLSTKLGFNNIEQFKKYLKNEQLDFETVKNKIVEELEWNNLIYNIYKNQVTINKDKIEEKLKLIIKKQISTEFEISEILVKEKNLKKTNEQVLVIQNYIKNFGFENAAVKYSVSETSAKGGYIGWVNGNEMSDNFLNVLSNAKIDEITKPIKISGGVIILKIKKKRDVKKKFDTKKTFKNLMQNEKNKQLNIFSIKHYLIVKNSVLIKYHEK